MGITQRKKQYMLNKSLKVNDELTCPVCGTKFIKKQWQQAFCCNECKNKYWNDKGDRHKDKKYYHDYNLKHQERLERIGIDIEEMEEEAMYFAMCENPILGK